MKAELMETFSGLIKQVVFYSIVCSIISEGIKKTIKVIMNKGQEESINRFIGLGLIYTLGVSSGFLLESEVISNVFMKIFLGITIATTGVVCYDSIIKSILEIVPKITNKLLGSDK
jgi:hypothetical protein